MPVVPAAPRVCRALARRGGRAAGLLTLLFLCAGVCVGARAQPQPVLLQEPLPEPSPEPVLPLPMDEQVFAAALASDQLAVLEQACQDAARFDLPVRLRQLKDRLVALRPAPQPLPVVLANANALISCLAPEAALSVLDRYGPGPGLERQQWLTLQWRAANAGLNHRRAAEALRRLSAGERSLLETMALPVRLRDDGSLDTRSALDVLASHLAAMGRRQEAAEVLLAGRLPGVVGAERLKLAAALLDDLPLAQRNALLEMALDQAAVAGAWGLAAQLLDDQQALQRLEGGDPEPARQRRLRLSRRIDDAYAEWLLQRDDPSEAERNTVLERRLRSPREQGGHAPSAAQPATQEPQEPQEPVTPSAPDSAEPTTP
ncbi:hypothetical protein KBZ18_06620 [Synechococcus sp. Cruz-9H2]|nr:hypothetical protein [Synechococcus sp. Cruz-9H2]MCP9843666.1 hypothetical protein [Synechococcus sp. Edmonson 11F2]MCP9855615.1 hypothetical protein [Synechococcus sp. Cruz-9C9]MCP9863053.1 hypothetical protein [Synechococcus sp. Cruz-7E5]MCP9870072.1 hypothetical protein [Synechococcus sp. Cruz-7B9]